MDDYLGGLVPMARMVSRSGPPEAMICPFVLCTACGEPVHVSDADVSWDQQGHVVWWCRLNPQQQIGPVAVHKGRCDEAVRKYGEQRWRLEDGWCQLWDELDCFLRQLAYNAQHPLGSDLRNDPEYPAGAEYVAPLPSNWRSGHYAPMRRSP